MPRTNGRATSSTRLLFLEAAAVPQGKKKACRDRFAEQQIDNLTDLAIFKNAGEMFEGIAITPIMGRLATRILGGTHEWFQESRSRESRSNQG